MWALSNTFIELLYLSSKPAEVLVNEAVANIVLALRKAQTEILQESVNRGPSNHTVSIRDE